MNLPSGFRPSKQQKEAFDKIEGSSESYFIYGKAGSGKSSFIQYFRNISKKNHITLTFTGLAAVLIKGQTIHSFFQLPPRLILKNDPDVKTLNKRQKQIEKLDVLIIDEISTVSCDLLHAIDSLLQEYRNNNKPFGGIQMVFVGDFFQIAPIEPKEKNEWNAFINDYKSIWFFDSEGYEKLKPQLLEFEFIHRHKDTLLKNNLETIRRNQFDDNTLKYFNKRIGLQIPSSAIALCTTNKKVDQYNNDYLNKLEGRSFTYIGKSNNFKESELPTDMKLTLKIKARVMMISNDPSRRWVNGTFAFITNLSEEKIKIRIPLGKDKYSKEYEVDKETWNKYDYRLKTNASDINDKKESYEAFVVGSFEQYPIRIARATTIHKSQGQTFDNVLVDFDTGAFTHGQAYVALSRTRTYEGLFLKHPLKSSDIRFDEKVINYYNKNFQSSLFDHMPSSEIEDNIPFN